MIRTYEAQIDEAGNIRLLEPVSLPAGQRALVTVLDEPALAVLEAALLSEAALAEEWNRPEEELAAIHPQIQKLLVPTTGAGR